MIRKRAYAIEINDRTLIDTTDPALTDNENITAEGQQPHIEFDITIDALGHISLCDLSISNITQETSEAVFNIGSTLSFRCGYNDNIDYIFSGIIRNVFRYKDGATTTTQIIARAGKLRKSIINKSLGKNVKLSAIIKELSDAMGYALVFTKADFSDVMVSGYSMTGDPWIILSKLAYAYKFSYSLENDKLVIFKTDSGRQIPKKTINIQSGLEGMPERTEVGIDFSVRIDPSIKIGMKVDLDTTYQSFNFSNVYYLENLLERFAQGDYTVMQIKHSGDNAPSSNKWTTHVTGYLANRVSIA